MRGGKSQTKPGAISSGEVKGTEAAGKTKTAASEGGKQRPMEHKNPRGQAHKWKQRQTEKKKREKRSQGPRDLEDSLWAKRAQRPRKRLT